jgi:hypothetical protein
MNNYKLLLNSPHLDLFCEIASAVSSGAGWDEGYSSVDCNKDTVIGELHNLSDSNCHRSFVDDVVMPVFDLLIKKGLLQIEGWKD